ncbi:alpha/beta hydrolase [Nocardia callitridis]|uniref:Alpha/beta hydrolase n=1 Tax=Nocardia callitridis TaxID=648753 RepID=A0ABP9K979_9NOCA
MTATPETADAGTHEVSVLAQARVVDGIPMSGLLAAAAEPRAVILALHGGAVHSGYYDCPGHPDLSLLRTAAALGYTVLALDRPGYGASHPHADELRSADRRVELVYGALRRHLGARSYGAGLFVWAHSSGCELGIRVATEQTLAAAHGFELLGIELAGTGRAHQPVAHELIGTIRRDLPPGSVRDLLWQPFALYPRELVGGAAIGSPSPPYEAEVVTRWPRHDFPTLAPRVRVPVHFTVAEHENVWRGDRSARDEIAAVFPRTTVRFDDQPGAGHNLSLGHAARAYHLRALAFVEECVVARGNTFTPGSAAASMADTHESVDADAGDFAAADVADNNGRTATNPTSNGRGTHARVGPRHGIAADPELAAGGTP